MKTRFIVLSLVMMFWAIASTAQNVTLVLSGGGAKGLSHVGVLKALEENHIPVDQIVGNSMGALIGALYASGYTPLEIEQLVTSNSFKDWAQGNIDERFYYSKAYDPDAYWVKIPLVQGKGGLKQFLPTNFVAPYLMDYALMDLFSAAGALGQQSFDSLMIPFRCVATDIDSSKLVVLRNGQLGTAVRASYTFPFYIKPIRINNKLLFDGGMYNNFPVDVAREEFDADIIIGSKAAGNYPPADEADIISQLQNMLMRKADYHIPDSIGVLIESKMGYASLLDFDQAERYIDSGYVAAIRTMPKLARSIARRVDTVSLREKRLAFKHRLPALHFDTIVINGTNQAQAEYITKKLNPGTRFNTLSQIRERYFTLLADDKINFIYPELIYNRVSEQFELHLDVSLAEKFEGFFGGNISSTAVNEAFVGIHYKRLDRIGSRIGLNAYYGRFYSSVQVNGRLDFPGKLPFFIGLNGTMARKDYFKNANYFYEDPNPAFLINDERYLDADFGHTFGRYGKLLFGIADVNRNLNYYQTNSFSRNDTADQTTSHLVCPHFLFEINSLNRKQYANSGARLSFEARYYEGNETYLAGSFNPKQDEVKRYHRYYLLKFAYDNYFFKTGRLTAGCYGELSYSSQPVLSNYTATMLSAPSFVPVPEMTTLYLDEYRAFTYLAGGLKTVFGFSRKIDLRLEGYIFQPYKRLNNPGVGQQPSFGPAFSNPSYVGSFGVVYHSPLGPLSLSANYFDREGNNFGVLLNIGYVIFNRSMFD